MQKVNKQAHGPPQDSHDPLEQNASLPQAFPQIPQLLSSFDKSEHPVPQQAGVSPEAHTVPQLPQLLMLLLKSVQVLPHSTSGEVQVLTS